MASDPRKPLLKLTPGPDRRRPAGRAQFVPSPEPFPLTRQNQVFGQKFNRLERVLRRRDGALALRADPLGLAPERLLVFEVRGSISAFAAAVQKVEGLELVDEEELEADEEDRHPHAYLLVPDMVALGNLLSLWKRWQSDELVRGETPWSSVFATLKDLRPWGPEDRVHAFDQTILSEAIEGLSNDELIRLEIELVFRENDGVASEQQANVSSAITSRDGAVISTSRISDIGYHAILADLPVWAVREIVDRDPDGIAGVEPVQHIRPQAVSTTIGISDSAETEDEEEHADNLREPILALLDGVPVARHRLLENHVDLDDLFDLEPDALVEHRSHGTAMASLIIHGDRNENGVALPRKIYVLPLLGSDDEFPTNRLVIDLVFLAVQRMREFRPDVVIVNLSLGNRFRIFQGQLSPWARLLDRLAERFGLLFIVSAGNVTNDFGVSRYTSRTEYEDADASHRATSIIQALGDLVAERRLLSPAETLNGVTIGAVNRDAVSPAERRMARSLIDPFPDHDAANPSSALGPGFARAVKPDVLMPGAREHLRVVRSNPHVEVSPGQATRGAGLKVAAPPRGGRENLDGYTSGTSAAAALASRTCHRIHDALEAEYGDEFLELPSIERAVLLKALLVHPARWPRDTADLIRDTIGPFGRGQASKQKDNIRRFMGFGCVEADDAVACAADRATFFATGRLRRDRILTVGVPVPVTMSGKAQPHSLSATLAWFTPVAPGRKGYRTCRLKILKPEELDDLGVAGHRWQPDENQTNRGTVFSRCWDGNHAPRVAANMTLPLVIQRDPDQGAAIDEPVHFGLAVTLAMPGEIALYDEVAARVRPRTRVGSRP